MAGISDLPVELLERIYVSAIPSIPLSANSTILSNYSNERRGLRSAWAISAVCQHWRSIALQYQYLWRTIAVDEDTSFDMIKAWNERAGAQRLDLAIVMTGSGPVERGEEHLRYLERVDRFMSFIVFSALPSTTWTDLRSLCFQATHRGQAWTFFGHHLRDISLPRLENLSVALQENPASAYRDPSGELSDAILAGCPTFGGNATALRTISLKNLARSWCSLFLSPTYKLSTLEVSWRFDAPHSRRKFLQEIAKCSTLSTLILFGADGSRDYAEETEPVKFSSLRTVALSGDGAASLLPFIHATRLTRLELSDVILDDILKPESAPHPVVTTLVLTSIKIRLSGQFARIIGDGDSILPSLNTLVLVMSNILPNDVLPELHLPRLDTLRTLVMVEETSLRWSAVHLHRQRLLQMLKARHVTEHPLPRLAVKRSLWDAMMAEQSITAKELEGYVGTLEIFDGSWEHLAE